jgi:hypothetical protein
MRSEPAINVHNNFIVQGTPDARTQNQIAAMAGKGVRRGLARNA